MRVPATRLKLFCRKLYQIFCWHCTVLNYIIYVLCTLYVTHNCITFILTRYFKISLSGNSQHHYLNWFGLDYLSVDSVLANEEIYIIHEINRNKSEAFMIQRGLPVRFKKCKIIHKINIINIILKRISDNVLFARGKILDSRHSKLTFSIRM